MGRPRKPDSERRTKVFYLRLLPREMEELARAARERSVSVANILREGAAFYLRNTSIPPDKAAPAADPGPEDQEGPTGK